MREGKQKYDVVEYDLECPDCGIPMRLKQSHYGWFYGCPNYPECENTHGAHQSTGKPLGKPADKETRLARIAAHVALDRLWIEGSMTRKNVYRWLRMSMGLSKFKCHIARMNRENCEQVILLAEQKFKTLAKRRSHVKD